MERKDPAVKKILKGNKAAFTQQVMDCENTLFGVAMTLVKNRDDAGDCIQDAILDAYQGLEGLREEKYFKTWLIRILINRCYTFLRKQQRLAESEMTENLQASPVDTDTQLDVRRTLSALKDSDRLILTLYYMDDLPVKEIASLLNLTVGAVKLRLMRSREHFREAYPAAEKGKVQHEKA